ITVYCICMRWRQKLCSVDMCASLSFSDSPYILGSLFSRNALLSAFSIFSFISRALRFLTVATRTSSIEYFSSSIFRMMRSTSTVVFPLPAAAATRTSEPSYSIASSCLSVHWTMVFHPAFKILYRFVIHRIHPDVPPVDQRIDAAGGFEIAHFTRQPSVRRIQVDR